MMSMLDEESWQDKILGIQCLDGEDERYLIPGSEVERLMNEYDRSVNAGELNPFDGEGRLFYFEIIRAGNESEREMFGMCGCQGMYNAIQDLLRTKWVEPYRTKGNT